MKKFNFFLLAGFFVAFISCTHSCEGGDPELEGTLREVKLRFPVIKTDSFPNGRDLPTDEDFKQIEEAIFSRSSGYRLPETLVSFYKKVGNLRFSGVYIYTPEGGVKSNLYQLIREGQEKKIPNEWIAFGKMTECEYYCINHHTGEICLYVVFPKIRIDTTYSDLSSWIRRCFSLA